MPERLFFMVSPDHLAPVPFSCRSMACVRQADRYPWLRGPKGAGDDRGLRFLGSLSGCLTGVNTVSTTKACLTAPKERFVSVRRQRLMNDVCRWHVSNATVDAIRHAIQQRQRDRRSIPPRRHGRRHRWMVRYTFDLSRYCMIMIFFCLSESLIQRRVSFRKPNRCKASCCPERTRESIPVIDSL